MPLAIERWRTKAPWKERAGLSEGKWARSNRYSKSNLVGTAGLLLLRFNKAAQLHRSVECSNFDLRSLNHRNAKSTHLFRRAEFRWFVEYL